MTIPKLIKYPAIKFQPCLVKGVRITPLIHLIEVPDAKEAVLSYAGNNAKHLEKLREIKVFNLPAKLNHAGDIIHNAGVDRTDWFFQDNDTIKLFACELDKYPERKLIVASNAGNAPLHDWEVNYAADQAEPLALKDFEVPGKPLGNREYFAVSWGPGLPVDIGYERFTSDGKPLDQRKTVIVGGRPLVHDGAPVSLARVLETSISEPRHVLKLPEIDLGNNIFIPLGLRSIQRMIRDQQTEELMSLIRAGEPILLDLVEERDCCGPLNNKTIIEALTTFGYSPDTYELEHDTLRLKIELNPYRHTFWAKSGDSIFIGIINNSLKQPAGDIIYDRVRKPVGLTIPELQDFLGTQINAEEAVLLGNGKDPRIYISRHPHSEEKIEQTHDIDARPSITAGMLSVVI